MGEQLRLTDEEYFTLIKKAGDIEAGSNPKGIWPKDLYPVGKRSKFERKSFVEPLIEKGKTSELIILDAGGGNGAKTIPLGIYLANNVPYVEIALVDMKEEAITAARNFTSNITLPPDLRLENVISNLVDFTADPETFDGVNMLNVLHFMETEEAIESLKKINSALKIDGILSGNVCSIFNAASIGNKGNETQLKEVLDLTDRGISVKPHHVIVERYGDMYFHTGSSLSMLIESAGFTLTELKWFRNPDYPNGHNDDRYLENIEFIASKV